MKKRFVAVAITIAVAKTTVPTIATPVAELAQPNPTVPLVSLVGCVETIGETWFLSSATDPQETRTPFATDVEIDQSHEIALGSNRFALVGVAEFLDADGLLALHQRAELTAPESVNATGQLVAGKKVAVKGLHITSVEPNRLNLTSVITLADTCD